MNGVGYPQQKNEGIEKNFRRSAFVMSKHGVSEGVFYLRRGRPRTLGQMMSASARVAADKNRW